MQRHFSLWQLELVMLAQTSSWDNSHEQLQIRNDAGRIFRLPCGHNLLYSQNALNYTDNFGIIRTVEINTLAGKFMVQSGRYSSDQASKVLYLEEYCASFVIICVSPDKFNQQYPSEAA